MARNPKEAWPPSNLSEVHAAMSEWNAWHLGSSEALSHIYGGGVEDTTGFYKNGIVGSFRKLFWGNPTPAGERSTKLHSGLAKNIARTSANLLFSKAPQVKSEDAATQERLDAFVDDGIHSTLLEAAETASALGGVYLKVVWDESISDRPWVTAVSPELAVPKWKWDKLEAVTFWKIVSDDGSKVVRLLETHEVGYIQYEVYEGTHDDLGKPRELADFSETAGLVEMLDENDAISTGYEGLTAVYVPNMKPNLLWKNNPAAAHLGRSDFAGIEGLMDQLDETLSNMMREQRLGKSRLIVDQTLVESRGKGKGGAVDYDRELIVPMSLTLKDDGKQPIEMVQFDFRPQDYLAAADALREQCIQGSGYSLQTFGLAGEGVEMTATEVNARERQTMATRNQKILYWKPALANLFKALLAIDKTMNSGTALVETPDIFFGEVATESLREVAANVLVLDQAKAISLEEKVRRVNPDFDDDQVADEVTRIRTDTALPEAA
ncbi:phage portal protein [Streptomyces phaeochromogenes]|uniref:phage portal protein n=1 Tax=Streptomyces phaeochromogenes TaxID=1923 RepID=UPI002E2BC6A9|nr:phage portal protein [Streptomyces phaeochromogenes]